MPREIVTIVYECEVCGRKYKTVEEATECETKVVVRSNIEIGDKFVKDYFLRDVAGLIPHLIDHAARTIEQVTIWEVVGRSHKALRRFGKITHLDAFIVSDGKHTMTLSVLQLKRDYHRLNPEDTESSLSRLVPKTRRPSLKMYRPEERERVRKVLEQLSERANTEKHDPEPS